MAGRHRLVIRVDEERYRALERLARARGVSISTVVRDAIDRHDMEPSRSREAAGSDSPQPIPSGSAPTTNRARGQAG